MGAEITRKMMQKPTDYRVLVSTDLGGDPDDIQSLIHLLHYSDILKLEGIVSSPGYKSMNRTSAIMEWIRRTDLDHLRIQGYMELMSEEEVLAVVRQGAVETGRPEQGKSTEGSKLIVEKAMQPDPTGLGRPLWILAWGALTDVAQALYDQPAIAEHIRIYSIGSNNTRADAGSRDYIFEGMKDQWPWLWWIENGILPVESRDTFRGYYLGGNQSGIWGKMSFLSHVIRGKGTTHSGMFEQKLGDAFPGAERGKQSLKEGDSPSFTYLLSPVVGQVGHVDNPAAESWGGQFYRPFPAEFTNYYTDMDAPPEQCRNTISKWRVDYLSDWKKRWERY